MLMLNANVKRPVQLIFNCVLLKKKKNARAWSNVISRYLFVRNINDRCLRDVHLSKLRLTVRHEMDCSGNNF